MREQFAPLVHDSHTLPQATRYSGGGTAPGAGGGGGRFKPILLNSSSSSTSMGTAGALGTVSVGLEEEAEGAEEKAIARCAMLKALAGMKAALIASPIHETWRIPVSCRVMLPNKISTVIQVASQL